MGVELWTVELDALPGARATLSPDELERADRIVTERGRARFAAARAALREVLAGFVGVAPEAVRFGYSERGKPRLLHDAAPEFNLSHSGRLALIAVGGGVVGADIEEMRPRRAAVGVARRMFSAEEAAAIEALSGEEQLSLFYATWTAREACAKALGHGLPSPAGAFAVPLPPAGRGGPVPVVARDEPDMPLALLRLDPAPGYTAAVVAEGHGWELFHRS